MPRCPHELRPNRWANRRRQKSWSRSAPATVAASATSAWRGPGLLGSSTLNSTAECLSCLDAPVGTGGYYWSTLAPIHGTAPECPGDAEPDLEWSDELIATFAELQRRSMQAGVRP